MCVLNNLSSNKSSNVSLNSLL